MTLPTVDEIISIHSKLIQRTGGSDGLRDRGLLVMLMALKLNDLDISYTQQELIDLGLSVASGMSPYDDILNWLVSHKSV